MGMDLKTAKISICDKITSLMEEKPDRRVIVAIDGRCAAGKTTLATFLQEQMGGTLFHMDDYFLRPEQRTDKRMEEPGGNVDYERFLSEVLNPLRAGRKVISCRRYDCKTQSLLPPVMTEPDRLSIVEGSYSCHPALWDFCDLHVFLDVSPKEQRKRIIRRNGSDAALVFANRWIPLEEKYFEAFRIRERCDLVLSLKM